jgi:release factor glutamine methyltransferase
MNLREWLDHGEALLSDGPHADRARRDAETLLLHHIGKNKAWLMAHDDEEFAGCSSIGYAAMLERRRKGEPIQYLTGECEFYGLPFRVTPDVLIPRPETEHLVERILELFTLSGVGAPHLEEMWDGFQNLGVPSPPRTSQENPIVGAPSKLLHLRLGWETANVNSAMRILDVGTGSGAIAVALAKQIPNAAITAIDISQPALSVAHDNAARNGVNIRFLEGDLLAPVAGEQFEIIVSNPPYVPNTDRALIAVEVREHEPAIALFGGEDGLAIYRRLIPAAYDALVSGGYLLFEFGFSQMPDIEVLLQQAGFQHIEFIHDLQGIPRVACAQRT